MKDELTKERQANIALRKECPEGQKPSRERVSESNPFTIYTRGDNDG